jgi:hypothetical protein
MDKAFARAQHKLKKRSTEARREFKQVKDKSLGKGLVRLARGIKQINTELKIINNKLTIFKKNSNQ